MAGERGMAHLHSDQQVFNVIAAERVRLSRRSIQHKGFWPLAFQTADLNHVVHERGKYAPIRWLARSPSDAIDELEAYRVGGALLPSPYLACSLFVRRPTWLLGALAATAMAAARWMMLVTRWTVERRRRRDKLYFKMVVRIITAAADVRPPDRLFAGCRRPLPLLLLLVR